MQSCSKHGTLQQSYESSLVPLITSNGEIHSTSVWSFNSNNILEKHVTMCGMCVCWVLITFKLLRSWTWYILKMKRKIKFNIGSIPVVYRMIDQPISNTKYYSAKCWSCWWQHLWDLLYLAALCDIKRVGFSRNFTDNNWPDNVFIFLYFSISTWFHHCKSTRIQKNIRCT